VFRGRDGANLPMPLAHGKGGVRVRAGPAWCLKPGHNTGEDVFEPKQSINFFALSKPGAQENRVIQHRAPRKFECKGGGQIPPPRFLVEGDEPAQRHQMHVICPVRPWTYPREIYMACFVWSGLVGTVGGRRWAKGGLLRLVSGCLSRAGVSTGANAVRSYAPHPWTKGGPILPTPPTPLPREIFRLR